MFKKVKNYMLIKALNYKLKGLGRMLDFKIDPETKTIDVSVLLIGEPEKLDISVKSYEMIERDGKSFIKIGEIETSKTWLNIVLDEFAKGDEVELSAKTANLLKLIM